METKSSITFLLALLANIVSIVVGSITIYQFITGNEYLPKFSFSLPRVSLFPSSENLLHQPITAVGVAKVIGGLLFWSLILFIVVKFREEILDWITGILKLLAFFIGLPTGIGLSITTIATYLGSIVGYAEIGLKVGIGLAIVFLIFFAYIIFRAWRSI